MVRVSKIPISFEKAYLNQLKENSTTFVEVQKCVHHLALHPFHLTDVNKSVKEILNEGIAKYNKSLNGILLGYQNVKLLDCAGGINYDNCFIHLDIEAEFYLFKPEVGSILNGIVNKKSGDHIGCLVHQTFNVSIPKPEDGERWLGRKAQLGHEIQFKIIFINLKSRLPYIKGVILSILSDDPGFSSADEINEHESKPNTIVKYDSPDEYETPKKKKDTKKKRKKHLSECFSETPGALNEEYGTDDVINYPKKHRKHKTTENNEFDTYNNINGMGSPEIHKKRKSKKNKKDKIELSTICEDDLKKKSKKSKKRHQEDESFKGTSTLDVVNDNDLEISISKKHKKSKKHADRPINDVIEKKWEKDDTLEDNLKNSTKRKKSKHKKPD